MKQTCHRTSNQSAVILIFAPSTASKESFCNNQAEQSYFVCRLRGTHEVFVPRNTSSDSVTAYSLYFVLGVTDFCSLVQYVQCVNQLTSEKSEESHESFPSLAE
jgi:hypothetical protein